ncbi:MAG TPA: cytochrome c [Reyranella sp.]|nr:cytochrome c [Reyranella sp.]
MNRRFALRRPILAVAALPLAMLICGSASAQDAERGHQLARRWCAGCHVVEPSATEARADGVPSFPAVAAMRGLSSDRLRAAMNPKHGPMPSLSLARRDEDDLIAYIESLKRR